MGESIPQVDFLISLNSQCTELDPMKELMTERAKLAEQHKTAEFAFCFGFPYVDFPDCGPAMVAYADFQADAEAAASALQAFVVGREKACALDVVSAAEAVSEAIRLLDSAKKSIVIADTPRSSTPTRMRSIRRGRSLLLPPEPRQCCQNALQGVE